MDRTTHQLSSHAGDHALRGVIECVILLFGNLCDCHLPFVFFWFDRHYLSSISPFSRVCLFLKLAVKFELFL